MKRTPKRSKPARFVACYFRVSTPTQSVESQRDGVERNAERLHPGEELREFVDVASAFGRIRATDRQRRRVRQARPGWSELMAAAERGEVLRIVVAEVSRIARDVEEGIVAVNKLRDLGVPIYVVRGGMDSGTTHGRQHIVSDLVQSETEGAWLSERTRAGLAKPGAGKPGRPKAIDDDGAQRVVELRAKGRSWADVAQQLDATPASCRRAWSRARDLLKPSRRRVR